MNEREIKLEISIFLLVIAFCLVNGIWYLGHIRNQKEAITLGYKKYNQTTGVLEWVTNSVIKVELPVDKK